jgi:16S rRNA processing protein RimM
MVAVGRITRSVGLKGEMSLAMLTDTPERFAKLKKVWVGADERQVVRHTVLSVRVTRSAVVLKLQGIESRSAADERRGQFVFVSEDETIPPKKGSFFIHDLVGMNVVTESGEEVGTVQEVMQLPAHDVWVVAAGGKEVLLPAVKEVIRSVDVQRRVVVIRPLEGLLE